MVRAPLSVVVAQKLRDAIVSGELAPGTMLPSEKELGARLGVGRSTLREALRILQAQGLLTGADRVTTQRPCVVDDQAVGCAALALDTVLRLGKVGLEDLVQFRVLLEGAVVRAAARSSEPDRHRAARKALEAMKAAEDIEDFRAADIEFHLALAHASGNTAYPLVLLTLRTAISKHLDERLESASEPQQVFGDLCTEHEQILLAIERGEPERAHALIESHIHNFYLQEAQ